MDKKTYIAIDLKSFYASVECVERGLNPLTTNLVVADMSRTNKTICLAVSPSLKSFGIPGRPRLFEVEQIIKEVNTARAKRANIKKVKGTSYFIEDLENDYSLGVDYLIAKPRMAFYIEYSARIYNTYLKYFAPEDIHVYSIDEVFIDVSGYLKTYKMSAHELTIKVIRDVLDNTGVTATAGIGTNLYLAKVAMDIVAKRKEADKDGVRIAELDERSYRELLWDHEPIKDFWRVGSGYAKRLAKYGLYTMGDIARFSLKNDGILYDEFGINAELIIDHAWGYEPISLCDIKNYKPKSNCISSGQVLHEAYDYVKTKLIIEEMMELLSLELVRRNLVTNQLVLTIGYDVSNINDNYHGEVVTDRYGRLIPKHSNGRINISHYTSSTSVLMKNIIILFNRIIDKKLMVRRVNITANNVINEDVVKNEVRYEQFDIFSDADAVDRTLKREYEEEVSERHLQRVMLNIKDKYGKNILLKGIDLLDGATTIDRNRQVGGHSA